MTSKDKLVPLLKGLKVDQNEILHLLEDQDWLTVAKILGFSIANYDKLLLSGRMLIHDLIEKTPSTVEAYIAAFKHKLQPPVYEYILAHLEELQKVTGKRANNDYKHDFSSASSLIKNYSAKTKANGSSYEAPRFIWMRIAVALYHKKGMKEIITCFKDLCDGWYTPASPTIFNAGFKKGQLASCFLLTVEDDSESIVDNGVRDMALISRRNGGIGIDISRLRHSEITDMGESNGVVPWMYLYNATIRAFNQGGKRSGACTIYLRPHHIDIFDFCDTTLKTGDIYTRTHDINTAIWGSWLFWERVKKDENWTLFCPAKTPLLNDCYGLEFEKHYVEYEKDFSIKQRRTVKARKLLSHIIQVQRKTGSPYLLNGDSCNFKSNQRNLGYIRSSNLCVHGDTWVLTDKGQVTIKNLTNQKVNIWNGNQFSEVEVKKTGENQPLITVYLSNGAYINCTHYHKFLIVSNNYDAARKLSFKSCPRIDASKLNIGDKLIKFDTPIIEGFESNNLRYPYTHGFYCGDGTDYTQTSGNAYAAVALYGDKIKLLPYLEIKSTSGCILETSTGGIRQNVMLPIDLEEKYKVPHNSSIKCRLEWFAGLSDADGCICKNGETLSLQIASTNFLFLYEIQLMLQTLGIQSKVVKAMDAGYRLMPDGNGGKKEYLCKETKRILISSCYLWGLVDLGWKPKRLSLENHKRPNRNASQFVTVSHIQELPGKHDTFCFNEPLNNVGIFNGILLGNCIEVVEYSSTTEIPSCNLSSLSLRKFIKKGFSNTKECDFEKLAEITRKCINNLNRVIDCNNYPLEKTKTTNLKNRPIGLGVSGFAELLHELDLPFCSLDSIKEIHPDTKILNKKIFACIYFNAMIQSIELSIEEGPYSTFQGSPLSEGKFQFTLWADEYDMLNDLGRIDHRIRKKEDDIPIDPKEWNQKHTILSNGHVVENNWDSLREAVLQFGVRNSLLIALMPTATSAQILRNCESVEAHMSCIYSRKVIKSNYPVVNRYLVWDLEALGLWNRNTVDLIQSDNGSIGKLPQFVKANPNLYPEFDDFSDNYDRLKYLTYKYKTMWELDTRIFLQLAADRGRYVCQSQSTNIYFADPSDAQLIACHLFAYGLGLKTLNYYLRELPATDPIKFTVDANIAKFVKDINFEINEEDEEEDPKEAELKGQNGKDKEEVEIITLSRKENKMIKCTEDVCMSCSS